MPIDQAELIKQYQAASDAIFLQFYLALKKTE